MKEALNMAKITSDKVDYINAHGTSTIKGDEIELKAISRLFSHNICVSSTKSSIGHLLGAAGSVEAIFSIMAIKNNKIPSTLNLNDPMNQHVKLIANETLEVVNYSLSNFSFGGTNTALLFKFLDI